MSLVANYESSESEEDGEKEVKSKDDKQEESDSTTDDESSDDEAQPLKLSIPDAILKSSNKQHSQMNLEHRKLSQNSVYSNPFAQSEASIRQTLSKHKELTNEKEEPKGNRKRQRKEAKEKKKSKLCLHFFKTGNCKYGNDCKFSHKLLNQESTAPLGSEIGTAKRPDYSSQAELSKKPKKKKSNISETPFDDEDDSFIVQKKKRPGLGDTIVPGKKVLKNYDKVYNV